MFRLSLPLFLFLCTCLLKANAQNVIGQPQFDYASKAPEVQAMQKFIDVPVSYFTGAPNISIPIYTVTSKGINVPVSISYHSGGIAAEDQATAVGLGWLLNAGGAITRTVRGNPDEGIRHKTKPNKTYPFPSRPDSIIYVWGSARDSIATTYGRHGGYYVDGGTGNWSQPTLFQTINTHNQTIRDGQTPLEAGGINTFLNGLDDGEPDQFYLSFGGYSGKFIFDGNRSPIFLPYQQDMKITSVFKSLPELVITVDAFGIPDTAYYLQCYFESFIVSTPDAKDYYFGETTASKLRSAFTEQTLYNAWALTRVVDRNTMDTIYLEYGGGGSDGPKLENLQKFVKPSDLQEECINQTVVNVSIQVNAHALVKKITSSKEELNFYYSNGMLDSIKLIDKYANVESRKMQFDYGKLLSGRIKLTGFLIKDIKANEFSPYSFQYYDTTGYAGAWAQDYWGFHNGINNGKKLMGPYPGCIGNEANRNAAWPAMKLDILTEISYPTGGKALFEYEPHAASSGRTLDDQIREDDAYYVGGYANFSLNGLIGGLRIKRIRNYDPVAKDTLYKYFYYNKFGTGASSGHLYIPPSMVIDVAGFVCNTGTTNNTPKYYLSTHNLYQGSGANSHVGYKNVTVREERNGKSNGYTEYEFYDDTNTDSSFYSNALTDSTNAPLQGPYDIYPSWQFKRLPLNYLNGSEKEKRVYDAAGNLLLKEKTQYKSILYNQFASGAVINGAAKNDICDPYGSLAATSSTMAAAAASPYARRLLAPPQSFYFFNSYRIRKMAVLTWQKISENYASTSGYLVDTTTYYYGNPEHISPTATEHKESKGNLLKQETLYAFDFNNVNSGDSVMFFMKKAFVNTPVAAFTYKNGKVVTGGYRFYKLKSRKDSTIILPAEEYLLYTDPAGINPSTLNLTSAYPKALNFPVANFLKVATYKYNPDNTMSYVLKKGGEKVCLLWDYNSDYVIAQVAGADSSDIAFTGFETNYNGNWNVAGTQRITTTAVTGKRSYNLSNGNITKAGLNSSKSYIVSYWSSSSSATVNGAATTAGPVKSGWTYFEHILPASSTTATVGGSVLIDELRLYPADAQMTSYAFDPFVGVTAVCSPGNNIEYYEYDNSGRLKYIRDADKNLKKTAEYFYTGFVSDTSVWRIANSNTRLKPCPANNSYTTNITQQQQININPNSPTYLTLRWNDGAPCYTCDITAWQNTSTSVRCKKDASNNNTGEQEQEQKDMNPCSSTYNQTRWVVIGSNPSACPLPPPPCVGVEKKMVNGICETGTRVYTASGYNNSIQQWVCKYHYEWSDCSKSVDYEENRSSACALNTPCTPP